MVSIGSLWLPILLSAVAVFVASSLSHMVLKLHKKDYNHLSNESAAMDVLREADAGPGIYAFPYCDDPNDLGSDEMLDKYKRGPVGMVTFMPNGPPSMGRFLGLWFVYCAIVSIFVSYLTGRTVDAGTQYLSVFRVAGTAAFLAYGVSNMVDSIWKGAPWSVTFRHTMDGLVYSLLTAGFFGWLWP